jgi:hypothetical protein
MVLLGEGEEQNYLYNFIVMSHAFFAEVSKSVRLPFGKTVMSKCPLRTVVYIVR